jgi:hypothetical protein
MMNLDGTVGLGPSVKQKDPEHETEVQLNTEFYDPYSKRLIFEFQILHLIPEPVGGRERSPFFNFSLL